MSQWHIGRRTNNLFQELDGSTNAEIWLVIIPNDIATLAFCSLCEGHHKVWDLNSAFIDDISNDTYLATIRQGTFREVTPICQLNFELDHELILTNPRQGMPTPRQCIIFD